MNSNKKILITGVCLGLFTCLVALSFPLLNQSTYLLGGGFNINSNACVTPSGYVELDEALKDASNRISFTDTSKPYTDSVATKTFGTVSRINVGGDGKDDIFVERVNPYSRIRSGLYVYSTNHSSSISIGSILGFEGNVTSYKGCIELTNATYEVLSNKNSTGLVEPRLISANEISSFSYLDQGTRVRLDNCSFSSLSSSNVTKHTSSIRGYLTQGSTKFQIKINSRNMTTTNEIASYLSSLTSSFTVLGNITSDSGVYKIDIGSKDDIIASSHEHTYTYNFDSTSHWLTCSCGVSKEKEAHVSSDWIIKKEPTAFEEGSKYRECNICKYVLETVSIPKIESSTFNIDIFALNDTHGTVKDNSSAAGIEKTSTYIKNIKKSNPNTFVLSSGDMWQGSMYSNNTKGKLMSEYLNEIGCASMTIGNHEFDWGEEYISSNRSISNFPTLGINIIDKNTNKRASYVDASTTYTVNNIKFGIIGAIGDCYSSISGSKVKDVTFKVGNELATLVKNESVRLRNDEKCDFIIYSIHGPTKDYQDELSSGGYVDLVFEGHSHEQYVNKDSYGIYHLQGYGYNKSISHVSLAVDPSSKAISISKAESIATTTFLKLENDPNVTSIIDKYMPLIGNPDEVIGYNSTVRSSSYLADLVSSLYLQEGLTKLGDSYDIALAGGYLSTRDPYKLVAGDVTRSSIYNLLPFDNVLTLCKASGYFINKCYVNTTNSNYHMTYNTSKGYSASYSYSSSGIYYLLMDTFGYDYYVYGKGYNSSYNLELIASLSETRYARDMMVDYVRNGGLAS